MVWRMSFEEVGRLGFLDFEERGWPVLQYSLWHQDFPQPVNICDRYRRSIRRLRALPSGSCVSVYKGPKHIVQRPRRELRAFDEDGFTVRPQFSFLQIDGGGRDKRSRSWWRRCVFISRSRMILLHKWHSVVRPPSTTSCGASPERRTSGSFMSGSVSDCWGTTRWQNWQRINLEGHLVVR